MALDRTLGSETGPAAADVWLRWLPYCALYDRAVCVLTIVAVALWGGMTPPAVIAGSFLVAAQLGLREVVWAGGPLWTRRLPVRAGYVAGLLLLFAAQRMLSPWYDMSQFMLYLQILLCLRYVDVVVGSAGIALAASFGELSFWNWAIGPAVPMIAFELMMAAGTMVMGIWVVAVTAQSGKRRVLIEELESTRRELAQAERQAGMLEERGRLAREIHDTITQEFVSVVAHLGAAEALVERDPAGARRHIQAAENVARASLAEARTLVWDLRARIEGQTGLAAAIEQVVESAAAEAGTGTSAPVVQMEISGIPRPLPEATHHALLRAAQEGIGNSLRHSGASCVTLTLTYLPDEVRVDVVDDGHGFRLESASGPTPSGGMGLVGMRERAAQLGGRVAVESTPGRGTAVAFSVPTAVQPGEG